MSSVYTPTPISTAPSYYDVGVTPYVIGPIYDLITININGQPYTGGGGGGDVTLAGVQTLSNKSLVDSSTWIINATDATKRINFDVSSAATGTTLTLKATQSNNRTFTFPNTTTDATFIMSQSNQSIVGDLTVSGLTTNTITQATTGSGVTVQLMNVRQDNLVLAAPSSNITLSSLVATGSNVSVALIPTGSGSIQAAIPDNTTIGGYTRGANAVDWQTSRSSASMVASGAGAVISGGQNNTASATWAVVSGGYQNTASASYAAVPYGHTCQASGANSAAAGTQAQSTAQGALTITDSQAVTLTNANQDRAVTRFANGYRLITSTGPIRFGNQMYVYTWLTGTTNGTSTLLLGSIPIRSDTAFSYNLKFTGVFGPPIASGVYSYLEENGFVNVASTTPTIINTFNITSINSSATNNNVFANTTTSGGSPTLNITINNVSGSTGVTYKGVCTLYINDFDNPDPV